MRRAIDPKTARLLIHTASEVCCPHCEGPLRICQHRERFIFRLDGVVHHLCRDKRCPDEQCEGYGTWYRPLVDLRLALPRMSFGLDVVVAVGEGHLAQGRSLSELGRELTNKGVPVHQTHVGRLLRSFLALCKMGRGGEPAQQQQLREQGGIVLMVDGVQFDDRSPVLYLCWDAVSGSPLFGQRMESRDTKALGGLLQRVKGMGVPVLGVVTDAEKGLVPAVQEVFPLVPHQLCHTHFLKNCAKPLEADLRQVGESVAERVEQVRKLGKRVAKSLESQTHRRASEEAQALACPAAPAEPQTLAGSSAVGVSQAPVCPSVAQETQAPACPSAPGDHAAAEETVTPEPPVQAVPPPPPNVEPISELELVRQLCALAKLDSRASGKAPLNPPELVRHQRLEDLRQVVDEAVKKKRTGHAVAS